MNVTHYQKEWRVKHSVSQFQNEERVKFFVLDFIIPQLVGKDISELWMVENPISVVAGILERAGRGPPEPRLLYSSGKNTLMSLFTVGIYSDEKMIGKCKFVRMA